MRLLPRESRMRWCVDRLDRPFRCNDMRKWNFSSVSQRSFRAHCHSRLGYAIGRYCYGCERIKCGRKSLKSRRSSGGETRKKSGTSEARWVYDGSRAVVQACCSLRACFLLLGSFPLHAAPKEECDTATRMPILLQLWSERMLSLMLRQWGIKIIFCLFTTLTKLDIVCD